MAIEHGAKLKSIELIERGSSTFKLHIFANASNPESLRAYTDSFKGNLLIQL